MSGKRTHFLFKHLSETVLRPFCGEILLFHFLYHSLSISKNLVKRVNERLIMDLCWHARTYYFVLSFCLSKVFILNDNSFKRVNKLYLYVVWHHVIKIYVPRPYISWGHLASKDMGYGNQRHNSVQLHSSPHPKHHLSNQIMFISPIENKITLLVSEQFHASIFEDTLRKFNFLPLFTLRM